MSLLEPNRSRTPSIAAVVVLYYPSVERLRLLYDGIRPQVDSVFFIDNTPRSSGDVFAPNGEPAWPVTYRPLGDNLGIAFAQNEGIRAAIAQGFDHLLLLDQDSLLPENTVQILLTAEQDLLRQGTEVAAVGPVFIDQKTYLPGSSHRYIWFWQSKPAIDLTAQAPVVTEWLIASGSLVRASVYEQVGLMREELFIDAVDMEWGIRARSFGLQSFVIPTAPISHSVGDSFGRFLGISVILHGELRNYYIARNWLYLMRIPTMGRRWRSYALIHVFKFIFIHSWFSDRRIEQCRFFKRAIVDGLRGRVGRYQA